MLLLPRVSPADFRARFAAFDEAARFIELNPADRHLAWKQHTADEHFHEWPVPLEHFVCDPYYVGPNARVRPKILEFLTDFGDEERTSDVFVFVGGLGSGKSFSAALLLTYALYQLSCMRKPNRWLSTFPGVSMSDGTELVVLNASGAGARQAQKVVYGDVVSLVEASPYFRRPENEPYPNKRSELEFRNRVRFSPGTGDVRSVLGFNTYAFVVDEAAFGHANEQADTDTVRDLFLGLNQRRRSRFGQMGFGGLFTSPQSESTYVEQLAGDSTSVNSDILVRRIATWEAKGELVPGASIFLLDRDPDAIRLLQAELIYCAPGVALAQNGDVVRFGPDAPTAPEAELVAEPFRHLLPLAA